MRKAIVVFALALAVLGVSMARAQGPTTQPGLFFTIVNQCPSPVRGFAVGDTLCLLKINTATFTRAIFQGDMVAGEKKSAMACTGADGQAVVLFVPSVSMPVQAVKVNVKPGQAVPIPSTFCGKAVGDEAPGSQFKTE